MTLRLNAFVLPVALFIVASLAQAQAPDISQSVDCGMALFASEIGASAMDPSSIPSLQGPPPWKTLSPDADPDNSTTAYQVEFSTASGPVIDGKQVQAYASTQTKSFPVEGSPGNFKTYHLITVYTNSAIGPYNVNDATWNAAAAPFLAAAGFLEGSPPKLKSSYTIGEAADAWRSSNAFCAFLGHTILHEILHTKLNSIEEMYKNDGNPATNFDASTDCAHMAVSSTAAGESCTKATGIADCIAALEDAGPDVNLLDLDCPEAQIEKDENGQPTESYDDYLGRLRDLKNGLCGAIAAEQERWNNPTDAETARCCFCSSPSGCSGGSTWVNPCPPPANPQPGDPPGITPPAIPSGACDHPQDDAQNPPPPGSEIMPIADCSAC